MFTQVCEHVLKQQDAYKLFKSQKETISLNISSVYYLIIWTFEYYTENNKFKSMLIATILLIIQHRGINDNSLRVFVFPVFNHVYKLISLFLLVSSSNLKGLGLVVVRDILFLLT